MAPSATKCTPSSFSKKKKNHPDTSVENFNLSNSYRFLLNHYKGKRFRVNLHLLLCQTSSVGLWYLQQRQRYIQKLIFHSYFQTGKWTQAYNTKKSTSDIQKKKTYWSNNAIKAEIQAENETLRKFLQCKCVFLSTAFSAGFTTTITTYQIQFVQKQNKQKKLLDWFCTQASWPCRQKHCAIEIFQKSCYGLYSGKVKPMENRKENFLIKHH